jgi:quinol monooxygenase YgiN
MSVVVVATLIPKPGRLQDVIDGFEAVNALVHDEQGCELYAAHTDGERVVMVERWTTEADLDAHATGAPIEELHRLHGDAVESVEVLRLENLPFGQPDKATIP